MGDKSVETFVSKIWFSSILDTFSRLPPKQCWFFYFLDCVERSAYTTLNWGAGGIRESTLDVNKIGQVLKYRKASFPKSVSTTFVAHCSLMISEVIRWNSSYIYFVFIFVYNMYTGMYGWLVFFWHLFFVKMKRYWLLLLLLKASKIYNLIFVGLCNIIA